MKEYSIYIRYGSACPYRTSSYTSFENAKQALLNMISDFDYRGKIYYIDNDFYDNKFPLNLANIIYYQIQERVVEEWEKYDQNYSYDKNKIINFKKYIDK